MRIVEIDGTTAITEVNGVSRKTRIDLLPDVAIGDYVLAHAGLAIAKVDVEEAEQTLALLKRFGNEI